MTVHEGGHTLIYGRQVASARAQQPLVRLSNWLYGKSTCKKQASAAAGHSIATWRDGDADAASAVSSCYCCIGTGAAVDASGCTIGAAGVGTAKPLEFYTSQ